jgi:chemosensory pili system protein ChpA (sensor histidine kinase/response regulator)
LVRDLEALDASDLGAASQQINALVTLLEAAGLVEPAKLLKATEALAQKLLENPELFGEDAASKVHSAHVALTRYLKALLHDKSVSSVVLFPEYRDVLTLLGGDRVHPADLWAYEWRWIDCPLPAESKPLGYDPSVRVRMDHCILSIVKTGNITSAELMSEICHGLSLEKKSVEQRAFWQISAAFFQSIAHHLVGMDVYAKRAATRVLMQYAKFAKGEEDKSERLTQDLLFFVAQANPLGKERVPFVSAVRLAYGLYENEPVNYEVAQFSDPDPASTAPAAEAVVTAELESSVAPTILEFPEVKTEDEQIKLPNADVAVPLLEDVESDDDQFKVIDHLRIGIALFNAYLNEADEWSRRLQTELSEWELELPRPLSDTVMALAHSLADSSAEVGFQALSEFSRELERALAHVQRHAPGLPEHAEVFVEAADAIRHLLHQFAAGFLKEPRPELLQALREISKTGLANGDQTVQSPQADQADSETTGIDTLEVGTVFPSENKVPESEAESPHPAALEATIESPLLPTLSQAGTVSVQSSRLQLLDGMLNQAGEVMVTGSRMETRLSQMRGSLADLTGNLERLQHQLREIEAQADSSTQSLPGNAQVLGQGIDHSGSNPPNRLQELARLMAESVNNVAAAKRNLQISLNSTEDDLISQVRQTKDLQRGLLRTRMVEFESISERLHGVVRQAALELDKQVQLSITGGSLEIERFVLDLLAPAFEHIVRKAVVHGIEKPELRQQLSKDESGLILIELQAQGNDASVLIRDDGAGLNLDQIRDKALTQGLVEEGHSLSEAEVAELIFKPGFSTAHQLTGLTEPGIGMEEVRRIVNSLGGRVEITTQPGMGTRFHLVFPLSRAITQVMMVRVGTLSMGVPANLVETVKHLTSNELALAYQQQILVLDERTLPFFWSGALLQVSQSSNEHQSVAALPVVILQKAGQRMALHVDEVFGNQELAVKNLGPQLSRLPGLDGISALDSGALVLIYNPFVLADVYAKTAVKV